MLGIGFVTAVLRDHARPVTWMNADIAAQREYMKIFSYDSEESIRSAASNAAKWAEAKVKARADYYNQLYPWRNPNVRLG